MKRQTLALQPSSYPPPLWPALPAVTQRRMAAVMARMLRPMIDPTAKLASHHAEAVAE